MERLIRYGTITDDPLYNCSAQTPEMIAKALTEPAPIYGTIRSIIGAIDLILFMLCVKVMLEPAHFVYPAYKIMIVISLYDMIGTVYNSLIFGVVYYYGIIFCDFPNFIYIAGAVGTSSFVTSSMLSSILIINRMVELKCTQNKLIVNIFNGNYIYLTVLFVILFGLYSLMFHHPTLLDPKSGLTFWDPQIFQNAASQYLNPMLVFNNTIVVSFNSILSIILCFSISKHLKENFGSMIDRRRQLTLFLQCLALVSLSNIGSISYVLYHFFEQYPFQTIGEIAYPLYTNLPPYIYLILNHSIRQGICKMFTRNSPKVYFSTTIKTTSTWSSGRLQTHPRSSVLSSVAQDYVVEPRMNN